MKRPRPPEHLSPRELYATGLGILGTVLAIVGLMPLSVLGLALLCLAEVALLVGVFLYLPVRGRLGVKQRRVIAGSLVIAGVLPLTALHYWPAPSTYATVTYYPELRPGIDVVPELGQCWIGSAVNGREDAWRCFASDDSEILDPCFQRPTGGDEELLCAREPWSYEVKLLSLTHSLPRDRANDEEDEARRPWALELATGERCVAAGGATVVVDGQRLDYYCDQGRVVYEVDLEAGQAYVQHDSNVITPVALLRAWN